MTTDSTVSPPAYLTVREFAAILRLIGELASAPTDGDKVSEPASRATS
jgi:hypothetical protein